MSDDKSPESSPKETENTDAPKGIIEVKSKRHKYDPYDDEVEHIAKPDDESDALKEDASANIIAENTTEATDDDLPEKPLPKLSEVETIWSNVILASFFGCLAFVISATSGETIKFSTYFAMIHIAVIAMFCLFRTIPVRASKEPADWALGSLAAWMPLFLFSIGSKTEIPLFFFLNLLGMLIATIAVFNLNRSFSVIPVVREIKKGGLYRLVRHPMYFGYCISITCIAIQSMNFAIIGVSIGVIAAIIMSINTEEKFLSQDPFYAEYMGKTRKKLIPFIW